VVGRSGGTQEAAGDSRLLEVSRLEALKRVKTSMPYSGYQHAANALYQSLDPDEVAAVVGYTYELDD
jgi:hypothetical protein